MTYLRIFLSLLIVATILCVLSLFVTKPESYATYLPREVLRNGVMQPLAMQDLPAALDKMEAVLKKRNLPYRRQGDVGLKINLITMASQETLQSLEREAGIRN